MSTDTDPAPRTSPLRAGFHERLAVTGRHDVPASVVVFLVALPLSLGVAVASGAPVAAGLIAANVVSGVLGGLPIAAVSVRSMTNAHAGAHTRAATVLHGVWILLFAVALVGLVQLIPKAALTGLLIVIGVQLVKLAHIRLARRTGDLYVYLATVLGVVFLNLLQGMVIGLVLLLWRVVRVTIIAEPVAGARRRLAGLRPAEPGPVPPRASSGRRLRRVRRGGSAGHGECGTAVGAAVRASGGALRDRGSRGAVSRCRGCSSISPRQGSPR